ncbi:hypothetical protein LTR17_009899 [Elasticomyces elasticus]|nr:hypothetical protein LTR17_009899 [Elasticomyces elasticus]
MARTLRVHHYWAYPSPYRVLNRSEIQSILRHDCKLDLKFSTLKNEQLAKILARLELGLPKRSESNDQVMLLIPAGTQGIKYAQESFADYRRRLIALADTDPSKYKFHRFLDLPPELRQRVYAYALSYSDNAYHLQQPAVSRVSRLLRTESLPIFYKCNRFGITVRRQKKDSSGLLWQNLLDLWPTYIRTEHLAMMRYFEVTLENTDTKHALRVKIDLPSLKGDEPLSIKAWSVKPEKHFNQLQNCQTMIEGQMEEVIEQLLDIKGNGRFGTKEVQLMALSVRDFVRVSSGALKV